MSRTVALALLALFAVHRPPDPGIPSAGRAHPPMSDGAPQALDVLIRDARVMDGSGSPWYRAAKLSTPIPRSPAIT